MFQAELGIEIGRPAQPMLETRLRMPEMLPDVMTA